MFIVREWLSNDDNTQTIIGIYDTFEQAINDLRVRVANMDVFESVCDEKAGICKIYGYNENCMYVDYDVWYLEKNVMI